jgi:hypothetical protein
LVCASVLSLRLLLFSSLSTSSTLALLSESK